MHGLVMGSARLWVHANNVEPSSCRYLQITSMVRRSLLPSLSGRAFDCVSSHERADTILFFGSARSRSPAEHAEAVARSEKALCDPLLTEAERGKQQLTLGRLQKTAWMCDVYVKVEALAAKLTAWSMGRIGGDGKVPYIISTGTPRCA